MSNPALASADVGDYDSTAVLQCYIARSGRYYLEFEFSRPGISIQAQATARASNPAQPSGTDIGSATPIAVGQLFYSIGDTVTEPHALYSIPLSANQLFSMKITRLGPWTALGYLSVARVSLYSPGAQTIQVYNPALATVDVGDYDTTAVLNYRVPKTGQYYLDFEYFRSGIDLKAEWISPVPPAMITSVNVAGGSSNIAQNAWIEIKGAGLAPADAGPNGLTWSAAPEFASGQIPVQLGGVSVKVNGKPAYIYYVSAAQVNALTPLDNAQGPVQVVVTSGANISPPVLVNLSAAAPGFLLLGSTKNIAATHAGGALLGPASMSVPGYQFTPAQPNETIVLYGTGFGLTSNPLSGGSSSQSGSLPALPVIQIGGTAATVTFAGVISPGLYQFNVIVPDGAVSGDNLVTASYAGFSAPGDGIITIQR